MAGVVDMLGAGGKSKGTAGAAGSIGGAPAKGMLGGIGAPVGTGAGSCRLISSR